LKRSCSAIVVNWNSGHDLADCLDSLLAQNRPFDEIIVVDNGSTDGSDRAAMEKGISFYKLQHNQGFASAANLGATKAESAFLAFINPDVVLDPYWLEHMLDPFDKFGKIGQAGGKVLFEDAPYKVENTGHLMFFDGLNRARSRGRRDLNVIDELGPPFFPSGCAAVYLKKAFDAANGFCEEMFAFGEDADLGIRLRMMGYDCAYVPKAISRHKLSNSAGRWSENKAYLVERNRIWVLTRTFPLAAFIFSPTFTTFRHILQLIAILKGRGAPARFVDSSGAYELAKTALRAYRDALAGLPGQIVKRREFRRSRPWPDLEFYRWLIQYRADPVDLAMGE